MSSWIQLFPDKAKLNSSEYVKLLQEIENKMKSSSEQKANSEELFFSPSYKQPSKKEYLEELKKQIEFKGLRKIKEKTLRNDFEVPENNKSYPNRIKTPKEIRRKIELEKMKKMRFDLEVQIREKNKRKENEERKEHEKIKNILNEDFEKFTRTEENKKKNKEKHRNILLNSWNQQISNQSINDISSSAEKSQILGPASREKSMIDLKNQVHSNRSIDNTPTIQTILKSNTKNTKPSPQIYSFDQEKRKFYSKKISQILETVKKTDSRTRFNSNQSLSSKIIPGGKKHFLFHSSNFM